MGWGLARAGRRMSGGGGPQMPRQPVCTNWGMEGMGGREGMEGRERRHGEEAARSEGCVEWGRRCLNLSLGGAG